MLSNVRKVLIGIALPVLLILSMVSRTGHAEEPLEGQILEQVAQKQGVPRQQLEIGTLEPLYLPLTGVTYHRAKVVDTQSGQLYTLTVDETGAVQDLEAAREAERVAHEELYGTLAPALYERLQDMTAEDRLVVGIWLRTGELTLPTRADVDPSSGEVGSAEVLPQEIVLSATQAEEKSDQEAADGLAARAAALRAGQEAQRATAEAVRQATLDYLMEEMEGVQAGLLADLEAQNIEPLYVSPIAPLVYAELSRTQILSLAQRADVDTLYGPNEYADAMNTARPTQKADVVDGWGFEGAGVGVAILEDSRIELANPHLTISDTRVPTDTNVDDHATGTAGMVASQHLIYQGISQGVDLYSANATTYGDSNLSDAMDWAASTIGADIINNSWSGNTFTTTLNVHDRHLDYIVRNVFQTIPVSAGNESNGCGTGTGRVTSPARGFNVISVGNYDDGDTLTWDDDGMDGCSSYVDPSTGVGKPEVAASGSGITSTTASSPWIGDLGSGTSYAAPMVSGEVALLMERDSLLENRPEAVKAIIMATALHNIEGDGEFSDFDGAGGVDMRAAFHLVDQGLWAWDPVSAGDFPYSHFYFASAGETVRAAIAWSSNPASDYSTDPLEADIDLEVFDPNGNSIASSLSFDNSYEIVEFSASDSGFYEMRISMHRFDGTTEYVGAAWWPGHRVLQAYEPQTRNVPPVSHHYYRFPSAPFWNAVGIRPPSGGDYDISLYANSAFGDPEDYTHLTSSFLTGSSVDIVLVDRNHAPAGDYYPETLSFSGNDIYHAEWATRTEDLSVPGQYGPYSMGINSVVRSWDIYFEAGQQRRIILQPVTSNLDLAIALFDSVPGSSSTWYQGLNNAVALVDDNGTGEGETLEYTNSGNADYMGLVVYSKGGGGAASFNLLVADHFTYIPLLLRHY